MMALCFRVTASAALFLVLALAARQGLAAGETRAPDPDPGRQLKPVSAFAGIADPLARSRALFVEVAKVITDPRCMNCHPMNRIPTQGDGMHPHAPFMNASESGIGVEGIACSTCHRAQNTTLVGSRLRSVPGNAHWSLAPQSMGWQGQSLGFICRQIQDKERNGGRSLADIRTHLAEDHLVAWAWDPGEGRRPAPGTHQAFGAVVDAWIDSGAHCPDE